MSTVVAPAAIAPCHRTRITGRELAAGVGTGLGLAVAAAMATSLIARAAAPRWAHTEGLTVLIVAEVYLAVIAGLLIAVRGRAGAARLLALRRPQARHVRLALALAVAATAAGLAVSLAFSPLSGGPVATLQAIVRDASDEARMPAATPLVWALILIRILALTGTAEEMLFRGALYGWLRSRFSVPATIALTTGLFRARALLLPDPAATGRHLRCGPRLATAPQPHHRHHDRHARDGRFRGVPRRGGTGLTHP